MIAMIKRVTWRLTPAWMHRWIRNLYFSVLLVPNVFYDTYRFFAYSGLNKSRNYRSEQAARIVMAYHQIEKGLSYATPRPGFGPEVIKRLLTALKPFVARYGWVSPATTAIGVLNQYVAFNKLAGIDMGKLEADIQRLSEGMLQSHDAALEGGVISVTKAALACDRQKGFEALFRSRYSIRHFSGQEIPKDDLSSAVRLAQKTPSVCNRQSWRVHAFTDREDIKRLLAIQAGSRGFGENATALFAVTCDLGFFVDVGERYQAWIDGGMFSMSLCLALHDMGYGTCCLNWSKEWKDDLRMHEAAGIDAAEQIIMLIAVGTLPEQLNVAYSARRPLSEVLQFH